MTTHTPADPLVQNGPFVNKLEMQGRLFAELSRMFGRETPLYDRSLLVNREVNKAVCELLGMLHVGFALSDEELELASGERHGAIRIGKPEEYRWIARFFAAFGMAPHNFYDMTSVGLKSQPVLATAFRSVLRPDHRVFCSLLQTDYFDPVTRARIEALLADRQVFSDEAKRLVEKSEREGGLRSDDAEALIREGTGRIFRWTGRARDHQLYTDLCASGFKIAADIACFERHHLNHLTPNTFCIDLYSAAMKRCMGEMTEGAFRERAVRALDRLLATADRDFMMLQFKRLSRRSVDSFKPGTPAPGAVEALADALIARLQAPQFALHKLPHAGFKNLTEGPSADTPILLRQDAYRALTEPVTFTNPDGSVVESAHTARFGEIEQRSYAVTPKGRRMYDRCLEIADAAVALHPGLAERDFGAYEAMYSAPFRPFPKTLPELLQQGLAYGRYSPTAAGVAAAGTIQTTNIHELIRMGYADYEGVRYEDFLPVSAAGIFASNLSQYGTESTAATKPVYTQAMLEEILGCRIIDADTIYRGEEAASRLHTYAKLGLLDQLPEWQRAELDRAAAALAAIVG